MQEERVCVGGGSRSIELVVKLCFENETRDAGWQRPIGCLKLQVIFHKRATNYRAHFGKINYKDKASYDSTPLCIIIHKVNLNNWSMYVEGGRGWGGGRSRVCAYSFDPVVIRFYVSFKHVLSLSI